MQLRHGSEGLALGAKKMNLNILSVEGVPISLKSVEVYRDSEGWQRLGLLNFSATCPGVTDEQLKAILETLKARGYKVETEEWKDNPFEEMFTKEGKKSYKLKAGVILEAGYTFKFGNVLVEIAGKALDNVRVKVPEEIEIK
jgi:hypothetical protein